MPRFGKRVDGIGGRRGAERASVLVLAIAATIGETRDAVLLNISERGAKLRCRQQVRVDEELLLRSEGIEAFGRVVWCTTDTVGLIVDEPLSGEAIAILRSKAAKIIASNLSPDEQFALENWECGPGR